MYLRIFLVILVASTIYISCSSESTKPKDDLNTGLVGYYPLSDSLKDLSGYSNDGIIFGAEVCEDRFGNPNEAYYFDGTDDYFDFGQNTNLQLTFPLTVSIWMKMSQPTSSMGFLMTSYNSSIYSGVWLAYNHELGRLNFNYGDGGRIAQPESRISYYISFEDFNQWTHVVGVMSDTLNAKLYINGSEVEGEYGGEGDSLFYSDYIGSVTVGRALVGVSGIPIFYNGCIDEIRFYNRALKSAEVKKLYND
jgi:hypothetical protein